MTAGENKTVRPDSPKRKNKRFRAHPKCSVGLVVRLLDGSRLLRFFDIITGNIFPDLPSADLCTGTNTMSAFRFDHPPAARYFYQHAGHCRHRRVPADLAPPKAAERAKEFDTSDQGFIKGMYEEHRRDHYKYPRLSELIENPEAHLYLARLQLPVNYDSSPAFMQYELEDFAIFTDCVLGICNRTRKTSIPELLKGTMTKSKPG